VPNQPDSWMQQRWRPLMAVQYMVVCLSDFIVFPVLFTLVQFWGTAETAVEVRQWVPITLQSGGFYHIAMGAVLGITAWSRGQEKLAVFGSGPRRAGEDETYSDNRRLTHRSGVGSEVETGYGSRPAPPRTDHPPR